MIDREREDYEETRPKTIKIFDSNWTWVKQVFGRLRKRDEQGARDEKENDRPCQSK